MSGQHACWIPKQRKHAVFLPNLKISVRFESHICAQSVVQIGAEWIQPGGNHKETEREQYNCSRSSSEILVSFSDDSNL